MNKDVARQIHELERRCRVLTGAVLALVAFLSTYGLLLVEGQAERPAFHIYPWLLALLFYLAGDLLALVWLRIIGAQMQKLILESETQHEAAGRVSVESESLLEEDIEVIRPRPGEGAG